MNTTKLLCKYLDLDKKGYVNGFDIFVFIITMIPIAILSISTFGQIGFMFFNGFDSYASEVTEVYTFLNIGAGGVICVGISVLIYIIIITLKIFFEHKFVICKKDNKL